MDADARRVLEMMLQEKAIGSKKLNTLTELMMSDGRLRGSTMYYGAPATGRWAGRGLQPQNLPRPAKLYTTDGDALYQIIMRRDVPALVAVVAAENEARIKKKLVDRLLLVDLLAAMLRGCLCAREGYVFIMADYNAIEARCVAWMADDSAAVQAFQAADRGVGADPYCIMAGRIYNRAITKKDETERQVGKVVELGCLASDTLVLTRGRGWVPIMFITKYDVVWDGDNWVNHEGLANQGFKPVINLYGVFLTPDHQVLIDIWEDYEWYSAEEVMAMMPNVSVELAPASIPVECYLQSQEYLIQRIPTNDEVREKDSVWDIVNAGPRNRFTVLSNKGPMIVHNCGYGLGWKRLGEYAKLQGVDMVGMGLDPLYVNEQYRDAHSAICGRKVKDAVYSTTPDECRPAVRKGGLWKELEAACRSAINGRAAESHGIGYEKVGDHVYCTLHSGRRLMYRNMHIADIPDKYGRLRPQIVYDKPRVKKHDDEDEDSDDTAMDAVRTTTWGGKLVENCLTYGTKVLTDDGWMPLGKVKDTHRVWDGVEWVEHKGVIKVDRYRSYSGLVSVNGVLMTPDHRVMAYPFSFEYHAGRPLNESWVEALDAALQRKGEHVGKLYSPGQILPYSGPTEPFLLKLGIGVPWEDVFDLANCGPRHRFTVLTDDGPLLVHNCDQADCRDLLASSLVDEPYIREHTVLHVHDEIVLEVPETEADEALKHLVIGMTRPKPFSVGMPLKAEAVKSKMYGKGKAILTAVDGELK